jgi:L-threonylcarbamoyladenylate synthase
VAERLDDGATLTDALAVLRTVTDPAAAGPELVASPPVAAELLDRFWPGGLTIVLPRRSSFVADLGGEDATTVGLRVPAQNVPGAPVTMTTRALGSPPARRTVSMNSPSMA